MHPSDAQRVIEDLRIGIPPDGYVCHFTVGRKAEINRLNARLNGAHKGALLLKANPGAGKSHLLRFLRERALVEGYVISSVTLDAQSAIRFNRMDQILGAIWRGLEIPNSNGGRGIRPFLNEICTRIESSKSKNKACFWCDLSNKWRWDFSDVLEAPAIFIGLRAWSTGKAAIQDIVEGWFLEPWVYKTQRSKLYYDLIGQLKSFFRDPRYEWQFYNDGIFDFQIHAYTQSWAAFRDIHKLSIEAGYKGFIILFDEFEDVIHNLRNIKHQQAAFWKLFEFYGGKKFDGMPYFAVTPDFANKCKTLLLQKGCWDYDYSMFDKLPTFEMSPLTAEELQELALKILEVHGIAYDWEPDLVMKMPALKAIVAKTAS
ncbi:MAG: ATP-binding protein, partial [Candidatus Subteraquimicrobiales bacterium]|nr:ATP-binding protein [Candidatus Subteraquimicrobiales bacterium]